MLRAQRDSIRLLQGVLVASVTVPLALFIYASWLGYENTEAVAERQIERTRDVVNEHALKVFETVEHSIAEINEVIRDMPDTQIYSNQENLHNRLKRLADNSAQVKSVWIFDKSGRALVNSLVYPAPGIDFSDRDYFKAHVERDTGTYVGEVLYPRPPYGGAPFFGVTRRRSSPDGSFAGVIQASVLPEYFEGFYAKISREPGVYISLVRDDGLILARYPATRSDVRVQSGSPLAKAMQSGSPEGAVSIASAIDGAARRLAYFKLSGFPVYVVAGLETSAIRAEWLSQVASHLIFGLPATAALIAIVLLALRRTRRLYDEGLRRTRAEDALKQSQRLEALGQLTGGVAHDFNNLLMVIGGSAQKLRRRHDDPQDSRSIGMIESAVQKGESLTRQLLSFSRRQSLSPKVVDLVDCVERFHDVLKQSVRSDIDIELKAPRRVIPVKIDTNEFEIALLNLTLNARDAMPDGGRIIIAIRTIRFGEDAGSAGLQGDFAAIDFGDTGSGIPAEIQDRIFEPFFTTKKVDKGTGLGLSQVYGFAQQSGGSITVGARAERGATFQLLLPLSAEQPQPVRDAPDEVVPLERSGTVLLVEDNAAVSIVASDYLEQCGFNVLHASSAEAAIENLGARRDIDLVFSDIVMPGMSGLELARLIRDHHPEIPVVLTSGYSDRTADALEEGFVLLRKPYSLDELRKSLAQNRAGMVN